MATHYTVPTYFTAEGAQYAATVNKLKQKNKDFALSAAAIGKQVGTYLSTGALFAGGGLLAKSSFDSAKDYEEAVDSFHTIVSDLNETDFKPFQDKIDSVATTTKRSGIEVAQSFEKIAGLNAKFAETADGLGMVSTAAITLAKASKMELGAAAENLVGIMNQFSFGAEQADRTINALAAGQAVGAANITQTAEAFTLFGSVAAGANISLEKSVGLIQTLGKYSLYGAEAGTKIRGVILRLQKAGLGYASGQFSINDALNQTNNILQKLKTNKERDLFLNKLFGVENITAGRILANNVKLYEEFTQSVTGTSEAYKAAAINSGNLATTMKELGASWSRMITGSKTGKEITEQLTSAIKWLSENIEEVTYWAFQLAKAYVAWKALSASIYLVNGAIGIYNALFTRTVVLTYANETAQAAYIATSRIGASVLGVLNGELAIMNALMAANPVGLLIGTMAAFAGVVYLADKAQRKYNDTQKEVYKGARNKEVIKSLKDESYALSLLIAKYYDLGHSLKEAQFLGLKGRVQELGREQFMADQSLKDVNAAIKTEQRKVNVMFYAYGYRTKKQTELEDTKVQKAQAAREVSERLTNELLYAKSLFSKGDLSEQQFRDIVPKRTAPVAPKADPGTAWGDQQQKVNEAVMWKSYSPVAQKAPVQETNVTITVKNDSNSELVVGNESGSQALFNVKPKSTSTASVR